MSEHNRIDWIDSAKGIAIILIILEHTTSIDSNYCGIIITQVTLPLFYALSGYFFKEYISVRSFFLSKISSLIIPTLFFFWGACLTYWGMQRLGVQFKIPFSWSYAFDIFKPTEQIYCNGVIWFLISLFWVNCLFFLFCRVFPIKRLFIPTLFCGLGGG